MRVVRALVARPLRAALLSCVLGALMTGEPGAEAAPRRGLKSLMPTATLQARVVDADGGAAGPARVFVERLDRGGGARLRADDSLDGVSTFSLGAGRYRVTATRGPEFTVDQRELTVAVGETKIDLAVRRVVDSGKWVSCDLHVHSSTSFDSHVSPEARARALAASGVAFGAPTEHDAVGSYEGTRAVARGLRWAPAMEVTPRAPAVGHFTIVPYAGETAPNTRAVAASRLLRELRAGNPDALIQINHPRLNAGMGYFNIIRLDVRKSLLDDVLPAQVDTVEVLNGIELRSPSRTEQVFREWMALMESGHGRWATAGSDVHHELQMPGFPRSYALPLGDDNKGLIRALRTGRSFATSAPFLELTQGDQVPGGKATVTGGKATVHVKLQAAPWVDVRRVELWSGGRVVWQRDLPERALRVGPPGADAAAERRAALLLDEDVTVEVPSGARTLLATARGDRSLSTVLPGVVALPFALTNPLMP